MTISEPTDRLVRSPVFVLSSIRSGSTLLRCLLNSHPRICAPHELHIAELAVDLPTRYVRLAMGVAGLGRDELTRLLWDRVLHQQLTAAGKDVIVDKTPSNVLVWRRIAECWPEARYVFLVRHPERILDSALEVRASEKSVEDVHAMVEDFLTAMRDAMAHLDGLTIRYEDLTHDPAAVTRQVCDLAGVEWDPAMLDYGAHDHGPFMAGIGDFTDEIRSGRIIPDSVEVDPDRVTGTMRPAARAWGYLPA